MVFDVAADRSFGEMLRLLAPGGIVLLAGAAKGGFAKILLRLAAGAIRGRRGQPIKAFLSEPSHADLMTLRELIVSGKLRPVIDRTFPLAEAREAIRYLSTGQARAKVIVTVP